MVKPIATATIEKGTGKPWEYWLARLTKASAAELSHTDIAKLLEQEWNVPGWWAQTITVAFEQHIGRRIPGQTSSGRYELSVSRVVAGTPDALREAWANSARQRKRLAGRKPIDQPSTSGTSKRLYWRCKLDDNSNVTVSFEPKGSGKALISLAHASARKLDADKLKSRWAGMIEALRSAERQ